MIKHFLISGGAGFIGSNYVHRLLSRGEKVTVLDNLSRRGSAVNIQWLRSVFGEDSFTLLQGDVSNADFCLQAVKNVDVIVHLAGQVAVTTSIADPRQDFYHNALGSLNMLEAARLSHRQPIFLYASTNKVYGGMEEVRIVEQATRYMYADYPLGIPETHPLDFHSPYGCSKGCADQYVRDYARIYQLPTVVYRQSCIYGKRQFGIEDQGWLAWFMIATLKKKNITIYGNGKQVRDILYIDDLLDAYDLAIEKIEQVKGQVFNIGGGIQNTLSIWQEFSPILERLFKQKIPVKYGEWRAGDQPVYISDIRKAEEVLGWKPKTSVISGIEQLFVWVKENASSFELP